MNNPLFRKTETASATWRTRTTKALALGAWLLVQPWSALAADGLQHLQNTVPEAAASATKIGLKPRIDKLNLSLGLALRDPQGLSNFLADIYNPASPRFHHFITPEQFADQFGPSKEDYAAVVKFAHDHGLTVTAQYPNRMVVSVKATAGIVEKALNVTLNNYKHPVENRNFFAPDREPSLDLSVPLASIAGLDNFNLPKSHARLMTNSVSATPGGSGASAADGTIKTTGNGAVPQTGSGSGGAYEAKDFRAAYFPNTTLTGAGQSIGLLEFSTTIYASDISTFITATGASNIPVVTEFIDGASGQGSTSANEECSLDVEMAMGMCPGLTSVIIYDGAGSGDDIFARMVSDNTCKQLSASWTFTTDAETTTLLMEMAAQGQSYFNASGDSDAYVGAPPTPCDSIWVTTVGGTELTTTGALGTWTGETVWNDNLTGTPGQGTGGGISTSVAIPTWQQSVSMANNQGSTTFRNVPDVAACAYNVYVYAAAGAGNGSYVGTSCATPVWAGIAAMANQLAVSYGEPTVGFINPAVYGFGLGSNAQPYLALFHDVTSGNNEWSSSPSKYVAATGYDLCTGWGSPTGSNFLTALALPEPLRISPFASDLFTGPVGGPFSASQTYTLTNSGVASFNWALSSLPSWLDASLSSGTLNPGGGSAAVVLSIDPSATSLAAGSYTSPIYFTNTTDGIVQTLSVTLAVEVPPTIITQPTNYASLLGAPASFSVTIASNALVSYQWKSNGVALANGGQFSGAVSYSGATTSTLTITNVGSNNVANYTVVITNVAGSVTSSIAALSIIQSAPVIVSSPTNVTVLPGGKITNSVVAYGNPTFTYRWYTNGGTTPLATGGKYFTATTANLIVSNIVATNGGGYYCTVSNSLGVATSAVATVTVVPVTTGSYVLSANGNFSATSTQPENPYSAPVYVPSQSAFFGTTYNGGSSGGGGTYKVTTAAPTTITREASLSYTTQGAGPIGTPCLAADGYLYMTAVILDTDNEGTFFKELASSTSLSVVTEFNGDNGGQPVGGIMQASDANLYGTCNVGGVYGAGTIFKVPTNSTTGLTNLMSFDVFNGQYPSPVLVQGPDGYLYGTAENGGVYASSAGTIYKISTNGTFVLLHSFNGTNDGAIPIAGVTLGVDGNYYGTTLKGGAYNYGTVYQMTPAGVVTTLYNFTNGVDGSEPWGGLFQAPDGNFYGCAQNGGAYGDGTVFQISPTGNFTPFAQFDGYQGQLPEGNVILGPDNNLYGTAFEGGQNGFGTFWCLIMTNASPIGITGQPVPVSTYAGSKAVFAVATTGGPATSYQWQQNGTNLANGGQFSGATSAALTISNLTAANAASFNVIVTSAANSVTSSVASLTILQTGPTITSQPVSQTIIAGGAAVFSVTATGNAPLSYQWQSNGVSLTDGVSVNGSATSLLIVSNLSLASSGTTYTVIVSNGVSAVTSTGAVLTVVSPTSVSVSFTNLHSFTGASTDGNGPAGALMQGADGNLYGTASGGGSVFTGTIYKMTLSGTLTTLVNFGVNGYVGITSTTNGAYPQGALVQASSGLLYGVTEAGGNNDDGVFFRVATNGTTAPALTQFTGTGDSEGADCTLCLASDGNFYGTSTLGGAGGIGSIYKLTSAGTVTLLHSFAGGAEGSDVVAGLVQGPDGYLYGVNVDGGTYGYGTAFKITTNGALTTLFEFNGSTNGSLPFGGLVFGQDGYLYGTTAQGGAYDYGTVFKLTTNGTLTTLFSFAGTNGGFPGASLIQAPDGSLYGTTEGNSTTSGGGLGGQGTVFRITTNGVLTTLVWFDGYNGAQPEGALVLANNGILYGTCYAGGTGYNPTTFGGWGTVFEVVLPKLVTNSFTAATAVAALPYSSALSNTVTPPAGDTFTYSLVSGPSWLSVATNGALTGSPTNGNIGTNTFVISVTDSTGYTASTNLNLLVIADPAPTFVTNPIVEPWANSGVLYSGSIAGSATAPYLTNGDVITYALVSGPSWLTVSPTGAFSGTPTDSNAGTNDFLVSATDLGGSSNTATVVIYVNAHPVFSSSLLTYSSVVYGFAYGGTLASNVTDLSAAFGDTLTYSLLSGPAWLTVAPNGALSGTPGSTYVGTNLFSVEVTDTNGLSATATLAITVNADNPPVFVSNPFSRHMALAGTAYMGSIALSATDPDAGDMLTYAKVSGPAWLSVAGSGALSGTPGDSDGGIGSFLVSVTDLDGLTTNATLTIYVDAHPAFSSPVLAYTPAVVGLSYSGTLATNVSDPTLAGTNYLTYSLVSGPSWLTVATNGTISGTPAAGNQGPNSFSVQVVDIYGLSASATVDITVNSNVPPSFLINPLTGPIALASNFYSLDISTNAVETNAGDSLVFTLVSGPAWLTNSTTNGTFSGTPADSDGGTNTVVISATDVAGYSNTLSLLIYVDAHPAFSAPVLYYAVATNGTPYSGTLATNVTDPTLVPTNYLTYSLLSGPAWLSVATNGLLSGTPDGTDLGTNLFAVEVVDAYGLSASASLEITVVAYVPPTPPSFILNPLTGPGATAGALYSLDISTNAVASSPGDALTFALVSGPSWLTLATNGLLSGTPYTANGGTNLFTVSVTDLASSLSATGTVSVFVTAVPISETVTYDGTNLTLSWSGGVPPYEVQSTAGFYPSAWTNYYGPTTLTNLLISPTNAAAAYFRVQGQ